MARPALFAKILQPHHDIQKVKYFTARVSGTPADPSKPHVSTDPVPEAIEIGPMTEDMENVGIVAGAIVGTPRTTG